MNNKKAKAIRRAMRNEPSTTAIPVFHASCFTNVNNDACVRYRAQYVSTGQRQMYKLGKKIYKLSGVLPRR